MTVRLNKKSQTWFYRFARSKKSHFRGGFRTKKQAEESEIKSVDKVIHNEIYPEDIEADMTFGEAGQWFVDTYSKTRKRSWKSDNSRIKRMAEFLGNKRIRQITPSDVASLREWLKKRELASLTINHYQALMKAVINRLKKHNKYFGDNPAAKIEMEKVPTARVRFLYPYEETLLSPAVSKNPELWNYYYVALHTSMRVQEICSIRVRDIALAGNTIFVPNSKTYRSRHIPISNDLSGFLKKIVEYKQPDEFAIGRMNRQRVSKVFKRICQRAGIQDLTFHDLRHTFRQKLLTQGVPIYKVSKILGHSSVVTTEQHYGHLANSDLKNAVDKIDGIINNDYTETALDVSPTVKQESESNQLSIIKDRTGEKTNSG